jgi:hypothetical protein
MSDTNALVPGTGATRNYVRIATDEFQQAAIQSIRTIVLEKDTENEHVIAALLSGLAGINLYSGIPPFSQLAANPIVELFELELWNYGFSVREELLNLAMIPMRQTEGLETILRLYKAVVDEASTCAPLATEEEMRERFLFVEELDKVGENFLGLLSSLEGFKSSDYKPFLAVLEKWYNHADDDVAEFAEKIRDSA